ncbi:MAG: hypothetical protein Q4P34_00475 [Tissierellia bacterium]|nr:hypothetical protein [Tissierellia bacterium]
MDRKKLSSYLFFAGLLFVAISVLILIYNFINLPKGVCPANTGRPFAFIAFILLVSSILVDKIKK